jgi:hypothetical protein
LRSRKRAHRAKAGAWQPLLTTGADELGAKAVEGRYHVKHLHATILALMGLDPNALTFNFAGLDQKLVGVEGAEPIGAVMA